MEENIVKVKSFRSIQMIISRAVSMASSPRANGTTYKLIPRFFQTRLKMVCEWFSPTKAMDTRYWLWSTMTTPRTKTQMTSYLARGICEARRNITFPRTSWAEAACITSAFWTSTITYTMAFRTTSSLTLVSPRARSFRISSLYL